MTRLLPEMIASNNSEGSKILLPNPSGSKANINKVSDGSEGEEGSGRGTRRAVQTVRGKKHRDPNELAIDDRLSSLSVSTALDVATAK